MNDLLSLFKKQRFWMLNRTEPNSIQFSFLFDDDAISRRQSRDAKAKLVSPWTARIVGKEIGRIRIGQFGIRLNRLPVVALHYLFA
jgi:hypothetical protein